MPWIVVNTPTRNQKSYWREPLDDPASVLDIGMSELVEFDDIKDTSILQGSLLESETSRTPLIDIRCGNSLLSAESIVDCALSH